MGIKRQKLKGQKPYLVGQTVGLVVLTDYELVVCLLSYSFVCEMSTRRSEI